MRHESILTRSYSFLDELFLGRWYSYETLWILICLVCVSVCIATATSWLETKLIELFDRLYRTMTHTEPTLTSEEREVTEYTMANIESEWTTYSFRCIPGTTTTLELPSSLTTNPVILSLSTGVDEPSNSGLLSAVNEFEPNSVIFSMYLPRNTTSVEISSSWAAIPIVLSLSTGVDDQSSSGSLSAVYELESKSAKKSTICNEIKFIFL